jgi:L-threonylcarbamoyladenylate synthase
VRLLPPTDRNLRIAGECIAAGGLVALPTETVYGLGADAFNPFAVARVFEAKARPSFDPLIVHIAALSDIEGVAQALGTKASSSRNESPYPTSSRAGCPPSPSASRTIR